MKIKLLMVVLAGLSFSGCTDSMNTISPSASARTYQTPTPQKEAIFNKTMKKVGLSTKSDPKYKSFSAELDTSEKKDWFRMLMYRLWDRQITRDQFVSEGVSRYPSHQYEFNFIANGFQKYS